VFSATPAGPQRLPVAGQFGFCGMVQWLASELRL
jgi:hypothetical protein